MKKILLTGLLSLSAISLVAQGKNVDPLINVLETQEMTSDEKMQLYWDISACYWNTDLDKDLSNLKEGLSFAEKEKNYLWAAKFNRAMCVNYTRRSEFDLSLQAGQRAIDYAVKAGDKGQENFANIEIGTMYMTAGKLELALKYFTDVFVCLFINRKYLLRERTT
jgi:hypothetical protein